MLAGDLLDFLIRFSDGFEQHLQQGHQARGDTGAGLQQGAVGHGRRGLVDGVKALLNPLRRAAVVLLEELAQGPRMGSLQLL